jgi:hypothetical protein
MIMIPVDLIKGLLQYIVLSLESVMLFLHLVDLLLQLFRLDLFTFHEYLLLLHLLLPLSAVFDSFLHKCIVSFAPPPKYLIERLLEPIRRHLPRDLLRLLLHFFQLLLHVRPKSP